MDFLNKKAIIADLQSTNKQGIIKELVDLLVKAGAVKGKREDLVKVLMAREVLGSTGIGQGVGIPHGKSQNIKNLVAAFGLSKEGVDFESEVIPPTLAAAISGSLEEASSEDEIAQVFADIWLGYP